MFFRPTSIRVSASILNSEFVQGLRIEEEKGDNMKAIRAIIAVIVSVYTLFVALLVACCVDLALIGYWPTSWHMYLRAMNMNHVTPHQYLQGLNATCVVAGVLVTVHLTSFSIDRLRKIRG